MKRAWLLLIPIAPLLLWAQGTPPSAPSVATIIPKASQANMYFSGTSRVSTRSTPVADKTASASVPTKKTVAGARKYLVPGTISYGMR